jgi:hypothetical protein
LEISINEIKIRAKKEDGIADDVALDVFRRSDLISRITHCDNMLTGGYGGCGLRRWGVLLRNGFYTPY